MVLVSLGDGDQLNLQKIVDSLSIRIEVAYLTGQYR
jgi:hypothetical protein